MRQQGWQTPIPPGTSNLFCRSCSFRSKTSSLRSPCARERLYSLSFWHCLRHVSSHSLWQSSGQIVNVLSDLRLTNLLTFYLALRHSFWHSFWHVFPTVFWRSFWYSFLLTQHAISHSVWHIFRRSLWHSSWLGVLCGILHCVCQGDFLSGISPGLLSGWPFSCCVRSDMVSDGWSDTLSRVHPDIFLTIFLGCPDAFFGAASDITFDVFCRLFWHSSSNSPDILPDIPSDIFWHLSEHSVSQSFACLFWQLFSGGGRAANTGRTQERKGGRGKAERQEGRKEGRKERRKEERRLLTYK